jgi:hypothetical protein
MGEAMPFLFFLVKVITFLFFSSLSFAGDSFLIAAVGDTMIGDAGGKLKAGLLANDGKNLFKELAPTIRKADLSFLNLEGPLADEGTSIKCRTNSKKCFIFRQPTKYIKLIKDAGFDLVSLANNHINDYGEGGIKSTMKTLDKAGLIYSGPVGKLGTYKLKGLKIGFIAMGTNWRVYNLNNLKVAKKEVSKLAEKNDIVIVSFHGGGEGARALHVPRGVEYYHGENRGNLRKFAKVVIDAGADLVLGHGPHVPRGIEIYKDRLIAYSLGNFFTYGFKLSGSQKLGPVLLVNMDKNGAFINGKIVSTKQKGGSIQIDKSNACAKLIKKLSKKDFPLTSPIILDDGRILPSKKRVMMMLAQLFKRF